MTRIPGSPEEKLALLTGIDQRTLPHLVGDILYFSLDHRNVRVVDGPADGKRDIHSSKPNGERHISQCKYHANTSATVTTDETDELVLALMKFGSKSGIFVTTGRISPQAKREYLDNYPGYELDFFDGINLVDMVLASPVLSAVWFDGKSILHSRQALQLPFVIRRIKDDHPIYIETLPDITENSIVFRFSGEGFDKDRLEPYRSPLNKAHSEHGSKFVHGQIAYCIGSTNLHEIPSYRQFLVSQIAATILDEHLPVTIRFATPSLVTNSEAIMQKPYTDEKDYVIINQIGSTSYVIDSKRTAFNERDWVILSDTRLWKFPDNLSVVEAPWAGWLNRSKNTICFEKIETPVDNIPYNEVINKKLRMEWLSQSLFILVKQADYENLLSELSENDQPTWATDYGLGCLLVGWLHPMYFHEMNGNISIQYNKDKGMYEAFVHEDIGEHEFNNTKVKIQKIVQSLGFSFISSDKAILISAFADDPLLQEVHYLEYGPAELFHDFYEIPSPVYLKERKIIFIRMWEIDEVPQKAREIIFQHPLEIDETSTLYWDARKGPKTNKTFLMSSLVIKCPPDFSCDNFFQIIDEQLNGYLDKIAKHIVAIWKDAKLSTVYFWNIEIGFKITDDVFEGNPWVIFANNKTTEAAQ